MSSQLLRPKNTVGIDWNVVRWLCGFGLGLLGDQIFFLALSWTAAQVASPSTAGLIVAVGALPRAILLLVGGAVSDRTGARRVALVSDVARLIVMVVFAVIVLQSPGSVPMLLVLALLFGAIDGFFLPSVSSLPPRIVTAEALPRTQSLRSVVQRLSAIGGPPLGGFILSGYGLGAALAVNAILFTFSVAALALTRERQAPAPTINEIPEEAQNIFGDIRDGLSYIFGDPVLRAMLILITVSEFTFAGPFTTGLAILGTEKGWGAGGVGTVLAGFGVGSALTALTIAFVSSVRRAGALSLVAIVLMGPAMIAVGYAPTAASAALFALLAGLASGVCATLLVTLILVTSDQQQLGRVMSSLSLATYGIAPLSYVLSGFLADMLGPSAVFLIFGILLSACGVGGAMVKSLRRLELFPHREPTMSANCSSTKGD